jgi:hypothetical protein
MKLELHESITKNLLQNRTFSKRIYQRYAKQTENPLDEATCKKILEESIVEWFIPKEEYVRTMIESWPTITAMFNNMTWSIYWADPLKPERFITGDFPFVIENKENGKFEFPQYLFGDKYIRVFFPLSSLTCLTMEYNCTQEIRPVIPLAFIPITNSQIAVHSQRYVVSKTKNIYWYKGGHIYDSIELLHKEFYPDKLNETWTKVTNSQGHFEKATPRTSWNKLKGDKPKDIE